MPAMKTRAKRVMTLDEARRKTPGELKLLRAFGVLAPVMGADGEGEGKEGEEAAAGAGDGAGSGEGAAAAGTGEKAPTAEDVANLNAALVKEREARKAADKLVKDLKPKADAHDQLTAEQQTELEKAQKEAADARDALSATTSKVRAANLKVALGDSKYGLASAKAAATLLQAEGIEFGDDDEPIDLDEAVEKLIEANPFLTGEKPKPKAPDTNGAEGGGSGPKVDLTADELAAAEAAGKTPEQWQALKGVKNIDDFNALQAAKATTQ